MSFPDGEELHSRRNLSAFVSSVYQPLSLRRGALRLRPRGHRLRRGGVEGLAESRVHESSPRSSLAGPCPSPTPLRPVKPVARPTVACVCDRVVTYPTTRARPHPLQHPQEQDALRLAPARIIEACLPKAQVVVGLSWRNLAHALREEDVDPHR